MSQFEDDLDDYLSGVAEFGKCDGCGMVADGYCECDICKKCGQLKEDCRCKGTLPKGAK